MCVTLSPTMLLSYPYLCMRISNLDRAHELIYILSHSSPSLRKYKWHPGILPGKMLQQYFMRLRIYSWFMKYPPPPNWHLRASLLFPSGDAGSANNLHDSSRHRANWLLPFTVRRTLLSGATQCLPIIFQERNRPFKQQIFDLSVWAALDFHIIILCTHFMESLAHVMLVLCFCDLP